jgi:adenylate kinase family enzyme
VSRLLLLAGPPGVGKTTVARTLFQRLPSAAWLDGDDVWRIRPWVVEERTTQLVEHNLVHVLGAYLAAGYDEVLLSWVLHRQDLVDRLLLRLGQPSHLHVALVCTPEELLDRRRSRGETERHEVALERLQQIRATGAQLVDTSGCSPEQVADRVQALLR